MPNIRKTFTYAVVSPTSMGLRFAPKDRQSLTLARDYTLQATSAETNVLNIPAALGERVLALTAFVKDSPMAAFIKNQLHARRIEYLAPELPSGGPWGYRHQFNLADSGFGLRGPVVCNDRAGEIGRILEASFYDLEELFEKQGVAILHLSGLIAALSPQTGELCLALAEKAKQCGTLVSFDMNYRASFWEGREQELKTVFSRLASLSDVLAGADLAACDYEPKALAAPPAEKSTEEKLRWFEEQLARVHEACPNSSVRLASYREVLSANRHVFGTVLEMDETRCTVFPREIEIYDRIGGGDALLGGVLTGLLRGYDAETCLALGWGAGTLAVCGIEDYATPESEEQLLAITRGNAAIRR